MAGELDVTVEIGYCGPDLAIAWEFETAPPGTPFDLTGSEVVLRIVDMSGTEIVRKSSADADGLTVDGSAGLVTWVYSLAESHLFQPGYKAFYSLERRLDGNQTPLVRKAFVVGVGGPNDD